MVKVFSLILIIILISCSNTLKTEMGENIYKSGFNTKNLKFIKVYREGDELYIEAKYNNNKIYLNGNLSKIIKSQEYDNRVFVNRIIYLNKLKDENNFLQNEEELNFKEINIIKYDDWSKIIIPVLESTIENLVPENENEGIVISIANKDIAFFYDNNDMIVAEKVEKIDEQINIVKTYSEKEFYNLIANEIKKIPLVQRKIKNNLIIFEMKNDIDDSNSPYVLFSKRTNDLYYFDFTKFFKIKSGTSNSDYYIQILFNAIIKSHVIEPIKNPITTAQKGSTFVYQGIKKTLESSKIKHLKKIPELNSNGELMDIQNFENELDSITKSQTYKGSMEYLIGGEAFFTDLANEIEKAKKEISIRLYIFSNDDYGVRISNILRAKDSSGVNIKVLTAALANNVESTKQTAIKFDSDFKQPRSIGQYLTYNSGINFRTSSDTFFLFDHSKMITLDKKIAYVGGMNIGQPYRYTWHDMMVKLKGPIVFYTDNRFNEAWASAGPSGDIGKMIAKIKSKFSPSKELLEYYNSNSDRQTNIRVLYTEPQNKSIYEAQMHAIKSAKKYIYIENPYLADYRIINALIEARGRGVDIRVILPSENNVGMMSSSNLVATNIFLKNGIRVFRYNGMTHIKAAIYDGWATLGSANFDNLSLMKNKEYNIAFSDPYYVNKLKKELFDIDFKLSEEILKPYKINWHDKIMSIFANRF